MRIYGVPQSLMQKQEMSFIIQNPKTAPHKALFSGQRSTSREDQRNKNFLASLQGPSQVGRAKDLFNNSDSKATSHGFRRDLEKIEMIRTANKTISGSFSETWNEKKELVERQKEEDEIIARERNDAFLLKEKKEKANELLKEGQALLKENQLEKAKEFFESGLETAPESSEFLYLLALTEFKLGDIEKASSVSLSFPHWF